MDGWMDAHAMLITRNVIALMLLCVVVFPLYVLFTYDVHRCVMDVDVRALC